MAHVLVVEDDLATRKMLRFILQEQAGHQICEAETAEAAEGYLEHCEIDLIMVDIVMPGLDGFELCKRVRTTSNVPIMIVSASGDIASRIRGLRLGADDYVPKPFDPAELAARVEALLRRAARSTRIGSDGFLRVGDLSLNLSEHHVSIREAGGGSRSAQLTPTEFKLLLVMARAPGRAFTRAELLEALWGPTAHADDGYATVNAYVSELRDRLEPQGERPRYLLTVRNVGYKLEP